MLGEQHEVVREGLAARAESARLKAACNTIGYSSTAAFLGTRMNMSISHSEISTRVPFCITRTRTEQAQVVVVVEVAAAVVVVERPAAVVGREPDVAVDLVILREGRFGANVSPLQKSSCRSPQAALNLSYLWATAGGCDPVFDLWH